MDSVDRVIAANSPERCRHLLIIDAPGLVDEALSRADRVSVWCDAIQEAELVPGELLVPQLDAAALAGVDLVWMRLPRALGALDEYAGLIAAHAEPEVRLIAGGREKHLNRSMNEVLARNFSSVAASLGQQKSRALMAGEPLPPAKLSWPRHKAITLGERTIELYWHGDTFAAGRVDDGTRLLIDNLDAVADADRYLDLGCGSGILAALIADQHPDAEVHAVDSSWAAVEACRLTAGPGGVQVHWAHDLAAFGDQSLDVIVCNPPFHRGAAKDSGPAFGIFAEAARTLINGGEFWCVFNSHLPWREHLGRQIGPTRVIAQNRSFTVTRSLRQP